MAGLTERQVDVNGISMRVVEQGDRGRPVVLCHGFPELAFSWRHELPALAAAGYHAIAPDQRGYGGTDAPPEIEDYDIYHLSADMLALLDAYDYERAVFVGHDWGAIVVWHIAIAHPERVEAVCGMSVPYRPRGRRRPTDAWDELFGDSFFYMRYFQKPGVADAELARDARTTMTRVLAGLTAELLVRPEGRGFLDGRAEPDVLPAWLTQAELDEYVQTFERTGFTGGLNWYRNLDRNWETTEHLAGAKVTVPALFVAGARDPVIRMSDPSRMSGHVTDLRASVVVDGAGHWVQQERPGEVNAALLEFLAP